MSISDFHELRANRMPYAQRLFDTIQDPNEILADIANLTTMYYLYVEQQELKKFGFKPLGKVDE